jgi:hypothetical protein
VKTIGKFSFSLLACASGLARGVRSWHASASLVSRTVRCPHPAVLSLLTVTLLSILPASAGASSPGFAGVPVSSSVLTSIAAAPNGGFWVQLHDLSWHPQQPPVDRTIPFDGAPVFEDVDKAGSIAAIPGRNGYWIVTAYGEIHQRGDAPLLCSNDLETCSRFKGTDAGIIVGAAARPNGQGLWALGRDGAVWTAGDAYSYGDVIDDSATPTGIVATPSGNGYYIVLNDGGVYSFGDAEFYGSFGGNPPGGRDITGIALSIGDDGQVNGYWLVAKDGGVFEFGNAPFWGSTGGNDGGHPVTSIVSYPSPTPGQPPQRTRGYAWVHSNGHVGHGYGTFWLPPGPDLNVVTDPPGTGQQ